MSLEVRRTVVKPRKTRDLLREMELLFLSIFEEPSQ